MRKTFSGIKLFYQTPGLWKYSLLPLAVVMIVYIVLAVAGYHVLSAFAEYVNKQCSALPDFLQWLATALNATSILLAAVLFLIVTAVSIGTLYELSGSLFFDALLDRFAAGDSNFCRKPTLKFICRGIFDTMLYSLNTLLIMLLLMMVNLFLPLIGQIFAFLLISYRLAIVYLTMAGFHCCKSMNQTRCCAYKNWPITLGYGVSLYIIFLFPPAVIFLLPGVVLGSVLACKKIMHDF